MKNLPLILLLITAIAFTSCSDDETVTTANINDTTIITTNENLNYYIGIYHDNTDLRILEEPENAIESEIYYDEENRIAYYKYTPELDFVGIDRVKFFYKYIDHTTAEHYLSVRIHVRE